MVVTLGWFTESTFVWCPKLERPKCHRRSWFSSPNSHRWPDEKWRGKGSEAGQGGGGKSSTFFELFWPSDGLQTFGVQ